MHSSDIFAMLYWCAFDVEVYSLGHPMTAWRRQIPPLTRLG
jgi:hypothetical protein